MSIGTLIGYFGKQDEARKALQELAHQGYRRSVLISKALDGTVHSEAPFFWLRRTRYAVAPQIMADHARWLVSGESVLLLQATLESLPRPMALLREGGDIPPALFVMHPPVERRKEVREPDVKLSAAQILAHAGRHAREQQVDPRPQRTTELLDRLRESRRTVRQICSSLTAANRLEQKSTPAADWILDNEYILEGNVRDVLLNLPRRFYQLLPTLSSVPYHGLPCIYALAKNLVSHNELRLDRENILTFIEAYQAVRILTISELWAIPQMLRIALIESIQSLAVTALADLRERQLAEFWANRLTAANRRNANQLFLILAELAKAESSPSAYFGAQLVSLLYDEETALAPVQGWLERSLKNSLLNLELREQNRQTSEQLACGNAFTSLRLLATLDWRDVFEKLSRVELRLRQDPAGVYARMDFASRDRCRRAVEELARAAGRSEEAVAEAAINLATQAGRTSPDQQRSNFVGSWLTGTGRSDLAKQLLCRESLRYRLMAWIYAHHTVVYGGGILAFTALVFCLIAGFTPAGLSPGTFFWLILLLLLPVSQLAIEIVNYLLTRLLPPRSLPKMDFEENGIPDRFRTLVVVPMMLVNEETVRAEVEKLEIRYLANKEDNLLFSLFSDYCDASSQIADSDNSLLQTAVALMKQLNQRHGDDRFILLHRQRVWSQSEQKYIGLERKRGKLEELNSLIDGSRDAAAPGLVYVGDPDRLADVRFVITLDSDTQLPHGTARRLVETLAHPLNQPVFDSSGAIAAGSYTIIQPRVSPTLPSTSASIFSRLFADAIGIDPYTQAVSDVYQDLSGEGTYHGKGIYDVRAFNRLLAGRFPEGRVLSHDLIEGAHVRVGLASDIELYDDFPQGYESYSRRAHRWIRGDWQIAAWILTRVPHHCGSGRPNPLSMLNRWKIFDNLRRSLLPAASLALLLFSWFVSARFAAIAASLVALQLLFHPLAQPFTMATTLKGLQQFSRAKLWHDLLRAISDAALLPHQAAVALDAICRVGYRLMISRRNLLEWTAQANLGSAAQRQSRFVAGLLPGSLFSCCTAWTIWLVMPGNLLPAAPWLLLWFLSPPLGWLLNLPLREEQCKPLTEKDRRFLRQIARRTWHYFATFVTAETSWLPPDNYQLGHQKRVAMRTSPTNIGLWLTSVLAAHDNGYQTVNQTIAALSATMGTLHRLERYKGHLLNWYDIRTCVPLVPRYVSTVDSGNLLGALWTLDQGLEELFLSPLLNKAACTGLADTLELFRPTLAAGKIPALQGESLEQLLASLNNPPATVIATLALLRRVDTAISPAVAAWSDLPLAIELGIQITARQESTDRYLRWLEILAEKRPDELAPLGPEATLVISRELLTAPSLVTLAKGESLAVTLLRSFRKGAQAGGSLNSWIDRVLAAFATAQWLAGETAGAAGLLLENVRELSAGMEMGFLYDRKRKLFAIGYNASTDLLDTSSYDLLASEAHLGSFVAIARGDVPLEHWFSLGRPYGAIGRQRVLLSWTGTMFEYLMPLLFQKSYNNSLLDKAAREAVAVQIAYGQTRRAPWGISESAYADLDLEKTYQYKAFGVPALGLKRGLEEQLVVAPYATLLALNVAPEETVRNLRRLAGLGLLGEFGYFEAMDFSRQAQSGAGLQSTKRGVIIEAYMAHHQGMAFLALTNFLQDNPFPRRFHSDPRVRAFEALLQERIPTLPPLHLISTQQSEASLPGGETLAPSGSTFSTPHTTTPRSLLLSNGRYGLMVTNSGGGYSQWGSRELTRWRSDPTCDAMGTFCYIHEAEPERVWSTTWHPVGGKTDGYSVDFTLDRAVFRRDVAGILSETEVVVSPEDDLELRRITLVNHSNRTRSLNLTSYIELSMSPHNADRQHPAFNKLFIKTAAAAQQQALVASRRLRGDDEPLFVAHCLTLEHSDKSDKSELSEDHAFQFETDRRKFIGRGRTLANPMGATQPLGNSQGFVLDPILTIRRTVTILPGQRARVSFLLAAGSSQEQVLALMEKYCDPFATERAMDFAWGAAQQQLQLLHIQPDEARRFQQLASHLLFPNYLLRAPAERLAENRKGQSGLWAYGISGDLPLVLITVGELREINLVRQMLQAHTYWRMHGLSTDLVIINEEARSYERPLQNRLEQMIQTHTVAAATDRAGRIFLKNSGQLPEEDLTLLKAVASVVLIAARGTLPQQLGIPAEVLPQQERLIRKRSPREPATALPFMELNYFNSLGGFTPDGREYAIYLGPDTNTPAPWVNVIANPDFGTMVSETGAGFSWYGNSQRNRLTSWSNDPVLDPAGEALYIRDEESGIFWSPTAAPIRENSAYRARHGAGYTVFEHNSNGIDQELTVFVPVDDQGGKPVKLQRLRLTNITAGKRRLSLTYYVELILGESRETSQMQVITRWDDAAGALLAENRYHPEYGGRVAFVALVPEVDSYGGDRSSFIGRNGSLACPAAMELVRLSDRTGAGLDPCAALRSGFELAPGEELDIVCLLGQAASVAEVRELVRGFRLERAFENAFDASRAWWDRLLGTIEVHTPDLAADLLINRWLQYQSLSCRVWGRSASYQSGGAFGFRDQLQDVMSLFVARPQLAREQILLAASRQFTEGDVQHWWHPPSGAGIRSRISDDLLWLPYVVAAYVRTTGDRDILQEEIPFLTAPLLTDKQHECFSTPEVTFERATLFEHCCRAVNRGLTSGPHGLPLIGSGDWNDGMNLVGVGGKGESVWLAWFLCAVLQGMSELATLLNETELSQTYQRERSGLINRVELAGWDGEWYLRGTFDDGSPLGSAVSREARIDSLPQSWAWLSGAADPDRADQALESAWNHLVRSDEGLVQLFDPPFETALPSPGYIKGYPPGVRENGGQYTHAALWLAMAMARKGDGERAVQLLRMLNPVEHARDAAAVWRYGIEPYVVAADIYRLPGRIGQGGWSWYTGSAAWMYRAWVEEVLGVEIRGGELRINPVIPAAWPGFSLTYRHGETVYAIRVENPGGSGSGVAWVEMDGQRLPDGVIILESGLVKHQVVVRMGRED